jgi:hypothetical protein
VTNVVWFELKMALGCIAPTLVGLGLFLRARTSRSPLAAGRAVS